MTAARPLLPLDCANPALKGRRYGPVKYQILTSNGSDVLVGRLKVDTNVGSGHAFLLRRFDTLAISLTTMYRAAFPTALPSQEQTELHWAKDHFNLSGNNGSKTDTSVPRLAGVWIGAEDALILAREYLIGDIVQFVLDAVPDTATDYRRSKNKPESTTPNKGLSSTNSIIIPNSLPPLSKASSSPLPTPAPAKRRKESSHVPVPTPPPTKAPRRSMRATKSPTPTRTLPPRLTRKTPIPQTKAKTMPEEIGTPGGSDETVVDEDNEAVIDAAARKELYQQDIAEQKEMISRMKAQMAGGANDDDDDDAVMGNNTGAPEKRSRELDEKPFKMDFKEPETDKRVIVSNSRIRERLNINLETKQKSFAWGVVAFAFGFGAMTYLPDLF